MFRVCWQRMTDGHLRAAHNGAPAPARITYRLVAVYGSPETIDEFSRDVWFRTQKDAIDVRKTAREATETATAAMDIAAADLQRSHQRARLGAIWRQMAFMQPGAERDFAMAEYERVKLDMIRDYGRFVVPGDPSTYPAPAKKVSRR